MKRILIYTLLLCFAGCNILNAQMIQGKVRDKADRPIEGVAVVLQTMDSVYVNAVVTDSLGRFRLDSPAEQACRLLFQHLLYEPAEKEISSADAGVIVLTDKSYALDEVTVKADRPQVKVEGGKLTYDVPRLLANRTATNAYEIMTELPGVSESTGDNRLQLAGAGTLNVVLNGQLTTLSPEQLQQMLKNIPASRVQKAEVMYVAPAKYNVKGALINLVLSKAASDSWQGETGIQYRQRHYAEGEAHGNLLFSTKRLTVDWLLNGSKGRNRSGEEMIARHTLDGKQTAIEQYGRGKQPFMEGTLRLGLDYTCPNDDRLSAVYYLEGERSTNTNRAQTSFVPLYDGGVSTHNQSITRLKEHSALHNLHIQYDGHRGLSAGADYTRYRNPGKQYFLDKNNDSIVTNLINPTQQRVDRLSLFANHTLSFGKGYQLNYGVTGSYATSLSRIEYLYDRAENEALRSNWDFTEVTRQKEYTAALFAEISKSFHERFSATLALKGEYYQADYDLNGDRSTLWNDWALFPTLSLNYTFSPQHILQFNVTSDKTYPPYWATSAQSSPLNTYSYIVGNPQLKPYRSYSGQLAYVLKQKYTFVLFCSYDPDYFMQVPYQSDTEIRNIFRFENVDFSLQNGLQAVIPFSVKTLWQGNLSLTGVRVQHKAAHFHSLSFNRKAYIARVSLKNTFNLSAEPDMECLGRLEMDIAKRSGQLGVEGERYLPFRNARTDGG